MRVGAAALAGGIFGAVGTLCFFLAFASDYWLVASDNCGPYTWPTKTTPTGDKDANGTEVGHTRTTGGLSSMSIEHDGMEQSCTGYQRKWLMKDISEGTCSLNGCNNSLQ